MAPYAHHKHWWSTSAGTFCTLRYPSLISTARCFDSAVNPLLHSHSSFWALFPVIPGMDRILTNQISTSQGSSLSWDERCWRIHSWLMFVFNFYLSVFPPSPPPPLSLFPFPSFRYPRLSSNLQSDQGWPWMSHPLAAAVLQLVVCPPSIPETLVSISINQAWLNAPVIPVFEKWRQEDQRFSIIFDCAEIQDRLGQQKTPY